MIAERTWCRAFCLRARQSSHLIFHGLEKASARLRSSYCLTQSQPMVPGTYTLATLFLEGFTLCKQLALPGFLMAQKIGARLPSKRAPNFSFHSRASNLSRCHSLILFVATGRGGVSDSIAGGVEGLFP